jgi:hypothetical protein
MMHIPKNILRLVLSIPLLLISYILFAQYDITYQSDSIYRVNKVKYRVLTYRKSNFKNFEDHFDLNGRCTEKIIYDTTGRLISKKVLDYDSAGRGARQLIYSYLFKDNITKKSYVVSSTDSASIATTIFQYDGLNREIKSVTSSTGRGVLSERDITYDPRIITEKRWSGDTSYYQTITYFGKYDVPVKQLRKYILNGKTRTSEYRYKNIIDKSGNLSKRYIKLVDSDYEFTNPNLDNVIFFQQENYYYSSNGLLVGVVSGIPLTTHPIG